MANKDYEGPTPGDPSILSAEHDDLVHGLYELRGRFKAITADERVILEMSIMMLEYLTEYADGSPADGAHLTPPEKIRAIADQLTKTRSAYPIQWPFDDFVRLICSGGFEFIGGRLVPRL